MIDLSAELAKLEAQRVAQPVKKIDLSHMPARVVTLDIETVGALAHIYQLNTKYVGHSQVLVPGGLLGYGYKWLDSDEVEWVDFRDGYHRALDILWDVVDTADYVIGWNSAKFDVPKIKGYFARQGMPAPRPAKNIDLMLTAKTLGFESSSLDYVARMMGTTRKVDNGGASLWTRCLAGEEEAWEEMARYCKGDVLATEELFERLLPWMKGVAVVQGEGVCPRCGSTDWTEDGTHHAPIASYASYRCSNCMGTFRATRNGKSYGLVATA